MDRQDYWLNAVSMIVAAVAPILIAYGVFTSEQADLWVDLILALAAVIVPIVVTQTVQNFTRQQAAVKQAQFQAHN